MDGIFATLLMKRAPKSTVQRVERLDPSPAAVQPDLHAAIRSIGKQASTIRRESAEMRGLIDDSTKVSERSAQAVGALSAQVKEIHRAQAGIGSVSTAGLGAVDRVRVAVEGVGREVGEVVATLA